MEGRIASLRAELNRLRGHQVSGAHIHNFNECIHVALANLKIAETEIGTEENLERAERAIQTMRKIIGGGYHSFRIPS